MHDRHGPAPVSGGGMGMDGGGSPGQAAGAYQARSAGSGAGAGAAVMAAGGGARGRDTAAGHGSATGHGRSGDGRAAAGAVASGYGRGAGGFGHGDGARAGWHHGGGEAISGGVQGRAGHGAYSEGGLWPGGEAGDGPGDGLGARPGAGAQAGPEDAKRGEPAQDDGRASHDVYALELPRHMAVDPAVEGRFKALCAQTGFTPEQARAAVDFWVAETEAAAGHSMEQCEATLRKQWGRGYGERLEGARQAARVLDGRMGGRLGRLLQGPMGNSPEVVEMLSHVASALNEDSVGAPGAVPGGAAAGAHGPMSTEEFLRNVVFKR